MLTCYIAWLDYYNKIKKKIYDVTVYDALSALDELAFNYQVLIARF